MFETDIGRERTNEVVSRKWALVAFGLMALMGLLAGVAGYWRRGLTIPWMLADMAVILILSLYWFVDVLRHGPPHKRALSWRMWALMILATIPNWIRMFRM
jgi:hypothetical protein